MLLTSSSGGQRELGRKEKIKQSARRERHEREISYIYTLVSKATGRLGNALISSADSLEWILDSVLGNLPLLPLARYTVHSRPQWQPAMPASAFASVQSLIPLVNVAISRWHAARVRPLYVYTAYMCIYCLRERESMIYTLVANWGKYPLAREQRNPLVGNIMCNACTRACVCMCIIRRVDLSYEIQLY